MKFNVLDLIDRYLIRPTTVYIILHVLLSLTSSKIYLHTHAVLSVIYVVKRRLALNAKCSDCEFSEKDQEINLSKTWTNKPIIFGQL